MDSTTSSTFEPSLAGITLILTAPLCSLMGLLLSDVHLCLFRSPLLLNTLPHSLHVTLSLIGLCLPALLSLDTDWDCWLSGLLHVCTAMPPLLLNHFPHVSQFTAPSCSLTGLCLSSVHLCRALSHSLRNRLWHRVNNIISDTNYFWTASCTV